MSKKWKVVWQEADGEGREVDCDSLPAATRLSEDVRKRGWQPTIFHPFGTTQNIAEHVPPSPEEPMSGPPEVQPIAEEPKPKRKKR